MPRQIGRPAGAEGRTDDRHQDKTDAGPSVVASANEIRCAFAAGHQRAARCAPATGGRHQIKRPSVMRSKGVRHSHMLVPVRPGAINRPGVDELRAREQQRRAAAARAKEASERIRAAQPRPRG
jgi:hypothetical protein